MQARAIFEAAVQVAKKGIKVIPEVMIPLVGSARANWRTRRQIVVRVADGGSRKGRHERICITWSAP